VKAREKVQAERLERRSASFLDGISEKAKTAARLDKLTAGKCVR